MVVTAAMAATAATAVTAAVESSGSIDPLLEIGALPLWCCQGKPVKSFRAIGPLRGNR
jgi:hypothetical protein